MRSLAVLAVLSYHLDIPALGGGYLGVDLFFVISGFIITRNILQDMRGGIFSLREFYIRRFRRLFPALVVTILVTLVAGIAILPPTELAGAAESAVYAVFSLANFHFWLESGYFDAAAETRPFLHTWSLSVEEQFYLFWPTLLLLLNGTRLRLAVVILLLLFSLIGSLVLRVDYGEAVFYLVPFRLHQLMAGALIAILSLRMEGGMGTLAILVATIGFVSLIGELGGSYSPAVGAVLVTICGSLLLLGRETSFAKLLYGNQPMQWVGQRSYAIYLVHWPLVVLYKFATDFELNGTVRVLLFVVVLVLAALLHTLVEKPFRKRGEDITAAQKAALSVALGALACVVVLAGTLWKLDGVAGRSDQQIQRVIASVDEEVRKRRRVIRFGQCNLHKEHRFTDYDVRRCATPDPDRTNVLVIGDSLAADAYMMLSQAYPEIHFLQATAGECTAVLDLADVGGKYSTCEELNAYRFSELIEQDVDLIVLVSVWAAKRIPPLEKTVDYLHSRGKKVLVVGPRVVFQASIPLLISLQDSLGSVNAALHEQARGNEELLKQMQAALPEVKILDMRALQCAPQCNVLEGESLLYFDNMHFSLLGARRAGERLRVSFDIQEYINSPGPGSGAR